MRIVHLANHIRNSGNGIVNMMVDLACSQANAGNEVIVATSGGEFDELLNRHGVRTFQLPQSSRLWRIFSMIRAFRELARECQPDVVHAHMVTGILIGRFAAVKRNYVLVATVHNVFQRSASLMRLGDRVVCVTKDVAKSMRNRGISRSKIEVVRNGTIGSPRRSQMELPSAETLERPCIVTVAGMYERKGIRDLILAFSLVNGRFPESNLYLVGDGPDRPAMEALVHDLKLEERVRFTGFISDPRSYLRNSDVFVLASHNESGALALVEAREAGCAIIATDVDGNPEMLDFGRAGVLVPVKNPETLADEICMMLHNHELRESYRQRSRIGINEFRVENVCEQYLSIYRRAIICLGKRSGKRD
ncbi:glycosyltransferase family 4 protein [Paraburkholderia sabiae]|uniref:Glycosyltransferase family 4 protein n=1 Tax=Paraburkholderia sabiae TaxID=273251 RepID=A0ABU9QGP8_9BURK|nr:glycosyltransferase family 4 protein [Paraburkholderia sabiae]WJZ75820.1 glycosyltransferase family 4 protein [Paraburkholderia sabiae]CAD6554887.1 N-acetyl-alpha-D-glucosaminyl L-malate synthase [Paraburkholderia sabiae]